MRSRIGSAFENAAETDLRFGGTWTVMQSAKNNLLWALASAALGTTRALPLPVLRALGASLGSTAHALLASARATARANVARVFVDRSEPERRMLVRHCFATLGETLGETVALLRDRDRPDPIPVDSETRLMLGALSREVSSNHSSPSNHPPRSRGILFASAHLGPWELVAASLVRAGIPLVALARKSYDPRFSRLYERIRFRGGVRVLWRDDPRAAARIVAALRNGAIVGVPMDLRSRVESRDVPFLGHPAPTPIGPARIALRTRSSVVVGSVAPSHGGALVITASPIVACDLAPTEEGAIELTARINAEISRRILALPHAWVWMHERWTAATKI